MVSERIGTRTALPRGEAGASLPLLLGAFGIFGVVFGVWQVLLADLSRALQLSPGPLGAALSGGVLASLPAMAVGGRAVDRWGLRAVIVGAGLVLSLAYAGLTMVERYWTLVALLLPFFAATGVYDVGINAAAMGLERQTGRHVLAPLHAAFSAGGVAGALAAGALVAAGVPFRLLYVVVALVVVGVLLRVWCGELPAAQPHPARGAGTRFGLYREPALLLVALIATLGFLSEGAMESWSAIYLRSSLALPVFLGASGVAVFHTAMTAGRLGTAMVVPRLGRRRTVQLAGLLAAGGTTLALATGRAPVILAGFLLVGLALAAVVPVAFSLAGDAAPGQAGQASSVVTTMGYSGFLVGPVLIGGIAELTSLRVGLATIILAGLLMTTLATVGLARRGPGSKQC